MEFPFFRGNSLLPPAEYAVLRDANPVTRVRLRSGQEAYLVNRYDDLRKLLSDDRVSVDRRNSGFPVLSESHGVLRQRSLLHMDPPQHATIRRLLAGHFTVSRVAKLRPQMEAVITRRYQEMLAKDGDAEFVRDFALAVPSELICLSLGIPYDERHDFFEERTAITTSHSVAGEAVTSAEDELRDYVESVVRSRVGSTGDDVISKLVVAAGTAGVELDEVVSLVHLMLIAGHETSTNALALSQLLIFDHDELVAELSADPGLIPGAIEELLRYTSIVQYQVLRVAVDEIELGGTVIPEGSPLIAAVQSANHDPHQFADAGRFDIRRQNASSHVAFGYGIHQCLGQQFARGELRVAFEVMLNMPNRVRSVRPDEVVFKLDSFVFGPRELPVRAVPAR
ncbi:cytochrome P450 [Pseudonocardia nematodicida]|uniref:Cytochrome P450 n=1 Tax=Pseudonocardia nematodicida TaxID=1206997 RepID=A0ABV1K5I9_9PSEU